MNSTSVTLGLGLLKKEEIIKITSLLAFWLNWKERSKKVYQEESYQDSFRDIRSYALQIWDGGKVQYHNCRLLEYRNDC